MDPWDELATKWDDMGGPAEYADQAFSSLEAHVTGPCTRILDFGAGTGLLSIKLAGWGPVVATDTSSEMVATLKAKGIDGVAVHHVELSEDNLRSHAAFSKPFDLIVASSVCAFVPDFVDVLGRFERLLEPGGYFVQWDWHKDDDEAEGPGFSKDKLQRIYSGTNFDVKFLDIGFRFTHEEHPGDVVMVVSRKRAT